MRSNTKLPRLFVSWGNSHAIFDRLELFTPRCHICQLFIGHILTWPVHQQKFKISINIQFVRFFHFNHCVDYRVGIHSINRIAEQPVLPVYCEWRDCILAEIIGKSTASVFQIGLLCITPVENIINCFIHPEVLGCFLPIEPRPEGLQNIFIWKVFQIVLIWENHR